MDLNNDGNRDILSGSYSRMGQPMAGLFQVLWGQADGTFQAAEALLGTDEKPLEIPAPDTPEAPGSGMTESICTRPFAVDWDGDGDLDLVVGNFRGSFYWFAGEGNGKFLPEAKPILLDGEPLTTAGAHSDPFVVDWDGDGDLDLLSGSNTGGVQWARNKAGAGALPKFEAFEMLIAAGKNSDYGALLSEDNLVGPTTSTRVWVDDVNGDGKLDILVGDNATLVSPAEGVSEAEYQERLAAWTEEMTAISAEMAKAQQADADEEDADEDSEEDSAEQEQAEASGGIGGWLRSLVGLEEKPRSKNSKMEDVQERWSKLYQKRSEFMRSDSTGFVWLYQQK